MPNDMMNTKEVASYLGVHEKQVYALIKSGRIPATRVTGKWIFPKKLVDEWIEEGAKAGLEQARSKSGRIEGALLAAGSNDPILDMLKTYMRKRHPDFYIFSANTGSTDGLRTLNKGYTDIAWSHLYDPRTGEYNTPFLATYLPDVKAVMVHLFNRELGFLLAPGNPLGFRGFEDLARGNLRFVNRQKGSGTRLIFDYNLERAGIPPSSIAGYEREVDTHIEIGLSILSREADAGLATAAVAKLLGLEFIPVVRESFDMVMAQPTFFGKSIQAFLDILTSAEFRTRVADLGSYDFADSGKIVCSHN